MILLRNWMLIPSVCYLLRCRLLLPNAWTCNVNSTWQVYLTYHVRGENIIYSSRLINFMLAFVFHFPVGRCSCRCSIAILAFDVMLCLQEVCVGACQYGWFFLVTKDDFMEYSKIGTHYMKFNLTFINGLNWTPIHQNDILFLS